ncbi:hypothetical protein RND81_10G145200 [Saponaria officinalis]|uniref:Two-component response regulator n=1 Tax=Saponaria officinalis TaxID=3572 RepID=A0AAW1I4T9_SAPOF
MTVERRRRDEQNDQFPVGMRVLAVDDDPICLRLLETLLRKCQYHVTTTSEAITALKMLRENKNMFDLVISDVHMPDMDGFKLLELVGLEMDLPVIMLSANGDTKLVMKGITHGACDYLLKPIRLEELKNIWQHVVRRKKPDPRDRNSSNILDKEGNGTGGANSDQDAKFCRKRKEQNVDDFEEQDENDSENEDPSAQKKPRVVWSVELHQKFVAAVNQLGLDKAVPKKILELMNVEKLTRENVASHLQKYRLYLKRLSSVANQQANMVAALGGPDYLRMNAVNFHNFNASAQFQNNSYGSISPAGVLGRLNTPAGLGLNGLSLSGMVQLGHGQIPTRPVTDNPKFSTSLLPVGQTAVLQGMPTSLEFDQLQHKSVSTNTIVSPLIMQGCSQERRNVISIGVTSDSSTNIGDRSRSNSNWANAVQSEATSTNHIENLMHDISSNVSDHSTRGEMGLMSDNLGPNMSYGPKQIWDGCKPDFINHGNFVDGPLNSSMGAQGAYLCGSGSDLRNRSAMLYRFDSLANQQSELVQNSGFVDNGGRSMGNYSVNSAGSLEDVVTAMFNRV